VVDGDVEQALSKARRRLIGHQNRMHGGKEGAKQTRAPEVLVASPLAVGSENGSHA
jgi:hypothetical protein